MLQRVLASPLLEALTWPHGVDRYLESVNPRWSRSAGRGTVTAVVHQTPDTVTLTVAANAAWRGHRAGQFVNVGVEIDGVIQTRCYSVTTSSRPNPVDSADRTIEFTVKAQPGGLVSNQLVAHAGVSLELQLSQAEGDFTLPTVRPDRIVLISGGSGITPVLSMLRTLCDEGHEKPVTFVHYSCGAHDALHTDDVATIASNHPNVTPIRAYTEETGAELNGLFHTGHLDAVDPQWRTAEVYVCGPAGLMDAVSASCVEAGRGDHVHVERFVLAVPPSEADLASAAGSLAFTATGTTVENTGQSILEQAESSGLSPKFGCRMGICHTCTRPKTSGCVRDLVTGELSDLGAQDIQICISAPVGDVVVDL